MLLRRFRNHALCLLLMAGYAISILPPVLRAQTNDDPQAMRKKIEELVKQHNYIQALPLLEKMVVLEPKDHEMHVRLGFALLAQINPARDADERKALRVRAREAFIRAKETGDTNAVVDALIQGISPDGSEEPAFSPNKAANDLMDEAESLFSQGKLQEALEDYQKALVLDPKLYDAAVFSGDVYIHEQNWAQAESWYQKAVTIDPNREKAYRYSATPFMKQGKYDIARDRYIEAYITEPYSRLSVAGLTQWGTVTKTPIRHPKIEIPVDFKVDENGAVHMTLDAGTFLAGKNDGSGAWIVYGGVRSLWRKERFAQTFPDEKSYRHSLSEETDALRSVLRVATTDKKTKKLSAGLAKLKALDDKGLLEAYVLLATPDEGIVIDFPKYLTQNRDKLRRYVVEYVVTNGGK